MISLISFPLCCPYFITIYSLGFIRKCQKSNFIGYGLEHTDCILICISLFRLILANIGSLACCLTVTSHYLNQFRVTVNKNIWNISQRNCRGNAVGFHKQNLFERYVSKWHTFSQWVNEQLVVLLLQPVITNIYVSVPWKTNFPIIRQGKSGY